MTSARRRLLACLPLALAPSGVSAFRFESAEAEVAADYDAKACLEQALHDRLRAEVEARLEGRPVPPALAAGLQALARCPFCGCAVAGAADHGEAAQPPPG